MGGKLDMNSAFFRVLRRDALARSWALLFAICCTILAATSLIQSMPGWLEGGRLILILCALFLGITVLSRVASITGILMRGMQVEGTVIESNTEGRGPGLTRYRFMYEGEPYEAEIFKAQGLKPGDRVTVSFEHKKPGYSIIRELYL
jgi:hypothetical protein